MISFRPFRHHVHAAAVVVLDHPRYAGVVQLLANLLFALEAAKKDHVAFDLEVRDFDGHLAARSRIGAAQDQRGRGSGDHAFDTVMVK